MELAWGKLVPAAPAQVQTMKAKSFLSGATPFAGAGGSEPPPPPTVDDRRWMSERRLQAGAGGLPAVVTDLDGKRVRIGGYVVPLDFEATSVKEFLLVPFVGACIHVPPSPAEPDHLCENGEGLRCRRIVRPGLCHRNAQSCVAIYGTCRDRIHDRRRQGRDAQGISERSSLPDGLSSRPSKARAGIA